MADALRLDLTGRVAAVTGSARGIGWAIAERLAGAGASVILNGRSDQAALDARGRELAERFGVEVRTVQGDVGDAQTAQNLSRTAFASFRRLDVFVNNAGILRDALIGMIRPEDVEATLSTNLAGVLHNTQAAARLMQRRREDGTSGGSIVNITSIIGRFGNLGQLVYGASKAGVIGATLSAAKELAPSGIRVNAVAPGYIDTDMIRQVPPETHAARLASIGMGRIGTTGDIADVVLFLASDLSSYVTGQVIGVDGGMLI